jgi:hypothetical protein
LDVQNKSKQRLPPSGYGLQTQQKTSFVAYEFVALSLSILSFTFHPKKHSFPSDILIPKHSQVRERKKERERREGATTTMVVIIIIAQQSCKKIVRIFFKFQ